MLKNRYRKLLENKMNQLLSEGMKIPSRPAPPPPASSATSAVIVNGSSSNGHATSALRRPTTIIQPTEPDRRYVLHTVPRSRSTSDISAASARVKKQAPPRPPPPKVPLPISSELRQRIGGEEGAQSSIKIKLPGFKSRKKRAEQKAKHKNRVHTSSWHISKQQPALGSLIDLSSPTTISKCSSDWTADSLDSESNSDSDSSSSGGGGGGGGCGYGWKNARSASACAIRYPWAGSSQAESGFEDDLDRTSSASLTDPFSPSSTSSSSGLDSKHTPISTPTIIRPPPPSSRSKHLQSPPMPTIPPPPPPPEALQLLASGPPVPPRPTNKFEKKDSSSDAVWCVALYDYTAADGHLEDLSFKENDRIKLIERINDEWLDGELNGKRGIFPSSFVQIVDHSPTASDQKKADSCPNTVIALFNYQAQSWDDLQLKEGDQVHVLGRVNKDWLYGECDGKCGQFPYNYVAELDIFE